MEQGTVSGRVALLLRSAEVKPMLQRFVQQLVEPSLFFRNGVFRAGLLTWRGAKNFKKKGKNHSTQDSRVVPHHGTNWAALWLTAQIRRDAVLSESYGRGWNDS